MNAVLSTFQDKRLLLSGVLIFALAVGFWSGSRVPQLNEKAAMGTEVAMDTLGFDTVLEIQPDDHVVTKIAYTTVNWVDTNKKGMTFGVLFAACLMTLFSLVRRRSFNNAFANSALGIAVGTPLGVCVNCAAPIAAGMAAAGARLETTLATMISSPTMNVIVLTILFSLFPFYFFAIKVGFTLLFIILVIPFLTRFVLKKEVQDSIDHGLACDLEAAACDLPEFEGENAGGRWVPSFQWLFENFFKNLWFVIKATVPLMALAGLLGSVAITVLPWEVLSNLVPQDTMITILIGMAIVALIGTFLPVPISFDVIICAILLAAGMPVKYVMVLLFTLGIFSIYSFFIVRQSVSLRAAIVMYIVLAGMGVAAGITAHYAWRAELENNQELALQYFNSAQSDAKPAYFDKAMDWTTGAPKVTAKIPPFASEQSYLANGNLEIHESDFFPANNRTGKFERLAPQEIGIEEPFDVNFYKFMMPMSLGYGRVISSGDVNNDGWVDLLLTTENGPSLYINVGGTFEKQTLDFPQLQESLVGISSLVDLDSDGWLDIYVTTMADGDFISYNEGGTYSSALVSAPHYDKNIMTTTLGFADIDQDGDMDGIKGHWSIGWGAGNWLASEKSRNFAMINDGNTLHLREIENVPGVPIGLLISDLNDDNHPDVIFGNDFDTPDYFYLGNGTGEFDEVLRSDEFVEISSHDTMGIITSDIDNDLVPELYMTDVAMYPDNHPEFFNITVPEACATLSAEADIKQCEKYANVHEVFFELNQRNDVAQCSQITDTRLRNECITFFFVKDPARRGGQATCDLIPAHWKEAKILCQGNLNLAIVPDEAFQEAAIPQTNFENVLLKQDQNGQFRNIAEEMNVSLSGFAWNAKFIDVDNNEWQDLYVANGWLEIKTRRESNYFYRNVEGKEFVNETADSGLESYLATSSFTQVDIDNDGDQDIITIPMNGPIQVFRNENKVGNSVSIELRDELGNTFAIGGKIRIFYGDDRKQVRELLASGGFLSYDAPIAHFGLGDHESISRIEIDWPTGQPSVLEGDFETGKRYKIVRRADERLSMSSAEAVSAR